MMGYLKPLRRKVGVVTLLVACVFAAEWIRSTTNLDSAAIAFPQNRYEIQSLQQNIRFFHTRISDRRLGHPFWSCYSDPITSLEQPISDPRELLGENRRVLEFGDGYLGAGSFEAEYRSLLVPKPGPPVRVFQTVALIPHWSVVIPLTLLSGWLLLSKPRRSAPVARSSA